MAQEETCMEDENEHIIGRIANSSLLLHNLRQRAKGGEAEYPAEKLWLHLEGTREPCKGFSAWARSVG